jgi:hypothetical protein
MLCTVNEAAQGSLRQLQVKVLICSRSESSLPRILLDSLRTIPRGRSSVHKEINQGSSEQRPSVPSPQCIGHVNDGRVSPSGVLLMDKFLA